ncbi:MAG: penicillin-binding protein 1C [Deltaproteobacteria bacterium]|nr:penicillin-binding protein 1C [Deltaproteobacteria bacterium]
MDDAPAPVAPPRRRTLLRRLARIVGRAALVGCVALIGFFVWVVAVPFPLEALRPHDLGHAVITDRHGEVLREVLSDAGTRGRWVALADVSPHLVAATVEAEDHRFWDHAGVDGWAILRSAWIDLRAGEARTGASTITQQTIKLTLHAGRPRDLALKLSEIVWAWRLELAVDKATILEQYLNRIPYGNQLIGAEAAARMYFDKPASQLSLAEAAFMAVLPQSPARLNPYKREAEVLVRQRRLLERMRERGTCPGGDDACARALVEPLRLVPRRAPSEAEHLTTRLATIMKTLPAMARPRALRTTIDGRLQQQVEALVSAQAPDAAQRGRFQAAVVVLDTRTCEVLAWVGSRDHDDDASLGQNDAVLARRQPGSALKPFIYAAYLDAGGSPTEVIDDRPRSYETTTGTYKPENYDRQWHGLVLLRTALGSSLNIPAVHLLSLVGVPNLLVLMRAMGLGTLDQSPDHYGLGLALGNGEVRLVDLAGAYATLGRLGRHLPVRWLASSASTPTIEATPLIDAESAFIVLDWLADDRARQIGFGLAGPLMLPYRMAAKTGTSSDYRDNWAFGVTPDVTIGVWVGNFDGRPMERVRGRVGAAPLLRQVAHLVYPRAASPGDVPWYEPPPSLVLRTVCATTGRPPDGSCLETRQEWARRTEIAGP